MKILALLINLLGIPAILFTAIITPEILVALLYLSAGGPAIWGIVLFGFCWVLLPVLLFIAEINGWQNFNKRNYANSIITYKWALLDFLIMLFLYFVVLDRK